MLLRRCVPFAAALLLVLQTGEVQAQSDQDKAAARSLATQGAEAFTAGRFEETIDLLTRAEALVHAPTHLLLLARAQVRLGRVVAARETYLKILREELPATAPAAFKKAQADAREEIAAVEPKIASLRIDLEGAVGRSIPVQLDGQPVPDALLGVHRPIDPGKHVITVLPPGQSPIEESITLGDGERKELKIPVPEGPATTAAPPGGGGTGAGAINGSSPPLAGSSDAPSSSGPRAAMLGAGIAGAALGLGGVVLGAVFLGNGGSTQDKANKLSADYGCEEQRPGSQPACTPAIEDEIRSLDSDAASQRTVGAIGLIGGGLLLAGGAALLIVELTSSPERSSSAWITPYVTPTGLGVRGAF